MNVVWYAACVHWKRIGPFDSQIKAWDALRLSDSEQEGRVHAENARVWPERADGK